MNFHTAFPIHHPSLGEKIANVIAPVAQISAPEHIVPLPLHHPSIEEKVSHVLSPVGPLSAPNLLHGPCEFST